MMPFRSIDSVDSPSFARHSYNIIPRYNAKVEKSTWRKCQIVVNMMYKPVDSGKQPEMINAVA